METDLGPPWSPFKIQRWFEFDRLQRRSRVKKWRRKISIRINRWSLQDIRKWMQLKTYTNTNKILKSIYPK